MKIDGRYLKYLRVKHKLSLRAFAEKIYSSKSSVQRWEKSSPPEDDELLERIASVYSLTAEELKRGSDEKYGSPESNLSPEQLAELKFSVKWLIIPLAMMPIVAVLGLIVTFIVLAVV